VGLARYLATVATDDLDRTLWLADDLVAQPEHATVGLIECGRPSPMAHELATLLGKAGRSSVSLLIKDRDIAQSDAVLRKLSGVSCVWVFAENLFEAYMSVFATQLTFAMRRVARGGLPVIGVGGGAMTLGGLLVAQRVCARAQYELVSGLGWAPRVLFDGGADRGVLDGSIARDAVCSLPGLLGIDFGLRGGVRVVGGRVESVGDEPITLLGADDAGKLLSLALEPGQVTTIAPPPFAPFTRDLLPQDVNAALKEIKQPRIAPPATAPEAAAPEPSFTGKVCPMCNKVHEEVRVELAA
jgi:hypothetical protein